MRQDADGLGNLPGYVKVTKDDAVVLIRDEEARWLQIPVHEAGRVQVVQRTKRVVHQHDDIGLLEADFFREGEDGLEAVRHVVDDYEQVCCELVRDHVMQLCRERIALLSSQVLKDLDLPESVLQFIVIGVRIQAQMLDGHSLPGFLADGFDGRTGRAAIDDANQLVVLLQVIPRR